MTPSVDDTSAAERRPEVVVNTTPSSIAALPAVANSPQLFEPTESECTSFATNLSLSLSRFTKKPQRTSRGVLLVVVLDQELLPNQIMNVLIDTRAVLDSSGKPFVVRRVLRQPLWSSSLSLGSLLAEVFLSASPFEVQLGARMQSTRMAGFAIHPVTSENVSWRTLVVVLDQELHPNQSGQARAVRDSSGNPFVGLAGSDVNLAVAEQVIVPNGTVTLPAGDASPTTNIVVSFVEPVQLAGGSASFRIALWGRAEVLCGKNTVIRKGLQIGHNDCPNAGLDKLRAYMEGTLASFWRPIVLWTIFERCWQTTGVGQEQEPGKSPTSIWDCHQDQLVWIHRRPVSSSCIALERKWWVQAPQRLCWISSPGRSIGLHFLSSFRKWAYSILLSTPMRSR